MTNKFLIKNPRGIFTLMQSFIEQKTYQILYLYIKKNRRKEKKE